MDPVIELDSLTVRFGKLEAIKSLSGAFSGRSIGLLGPNGAGKTTLVRLIMGYLKPTSGSARVAGFDSVAESLRVRVSA